MFHTFRSFLLVICFNLIISSVWAKTFVVTSSGDNADAAWGDGNCTDSSGDCTLRAAIEEAKKPRNGRYKHTLSEEEAAEIIKVLKNSLTSYITNLKKDEKKFSNKDGYADIEIKYESSESNVEFDIEFKAMEDETHKALFDLMQSWYQKSVEGGNL